MKERYWTTKHEHQHLWTNVAQGYWSRYPNPNSGHVFTVDTLETKVVDGKLHIKRFILKNNPLPRWGEHFFKTRRVGLVEECVVDPANHTMTAYVRNIGLTKFMATVEKQTYTPDCQDMDKTVVKKEAWIDSSIYGFRSAIRKFGIDRYKKNSILATQGFEHVLNRMFGVKALAGCGSGVIESPADCSNVPGQLGSNPSGGSRVDQANDNVCDIGKGDNDKVCDTGKGETDKVCDAVKGDNVTVCDNVRVRDTGKSDKVSKVHLPSTQPVGSYSFSVVHAQSSPQEK